MSDDIRVYWDEDLGLYSICIGGEVIIQPIVEGGVHGYQALSEIHGYQVLSEIKESKLACDELVYDSSEREESEDCSALIDENLIIPTISDRGLFNELHLVPTWCIEDFTIFFEGHERLLREHEERTA